MQQRRWVRRVLILTLTVVLGISVVVAVTIGVADLTPREVWGSILYHLGMGESQLSITRDAIVWQLRLPRVLTAVPVGAGLAVCGAILQAVTRNPLADPYLLGLSSGASLGAVAVIVLGFSIALPLAAFAGSLVAMFATIALAGAFAARSGNVSPSRMILSGVAVSALFGALTSLVIFWSATGDTYRQILSWLLGSLGGATWMSVLIAGAAFIVVGTPLLLIGTTLDAFAFGDRQAATLGIHVNRTRWVLLGATALLTGAMVSVSGAIGFVGLIVPHVVRMLVGPGNRNVLPLSALVGAIFLLWADTAARSLFDPRELPVGIVTALIGAPVFAVVLSRARRVN